VQPPFELVDSVSEAAAAAVAAAAVH